MPPAIKTESAIKGSILRPTNEFHFPGFGLHSIILGTKGLLTQLSTAQLSCPRRLSVNFAILAGPPLGAHLTTKTKKKTKR